ncbi:MAG: DUF2905 domain-containing protein [Pelosinus sp.]|nr:DUF2905 domain-containing protein [Pelosinus sp.]
MPAFDSIGKTLMMLGIILLVIGAIVHFGGKWGLGRLPGDIHFERENFSFHFPLVTSIIISIIATILLNLFTKR